VSWVQRLTVKEKLDLLLHQLAVFACVAAVYILQPYVRLEIGGSTSVDVMDIHLLPHKVLETDSVEY
jgi:hypothetical protein